MYVTLVSGLMCGISGQTACTMSNKLLIVRHNLCYDLEVMSDSNVLNHVFPLFSQVDLCPLMCKLLQLTPSHQGNGSFAVFEKMMRKDPIDMRGWLILMTSLGIVALAILISAVIVICRKHIGDAVETKRLDEEDERRYLYHKLEDT